MFGLFKRRLTVDEVFPVGAHEVSHTYVSRPLVEQAVRDQLRHQNAIILFSGPSKSGKTVLCHRFATGLPKAHLHAYSAMTGEEFWETLRQAIGAPVSTELEKQDNQSADTVLNAEGKASGALLGASAEFGGKFKKQWSKSASERRKIVLPSGGRAGVSKLSAIQPPYDYYRRLSLDGSTHCAGGISPSQASLGLGLAGYLDFSIERRILQDWRSW